jgi:hypothetical protein
VEVVWPSGVVDTVSSVPADRTITIEEGKGITQALERRDRAPAPRATP